MLCIASHKQFFCLSTDPTKNEKDKPNEYKVVGINPMMFIISSLLLVSSDQCYIIA